MGTVYGCLSERAIMPIRAALGYFSHADQTSGSGFVPILFDEPWLQAAQFMCLVGYLFKSSGAVTVTGTTGSNRTPALSAFLGESGVGTTLPMNAQAEKNFLFITTKFFYENFLKYRASYLPARLEFIGSAFRTGQKTQGGKHPDTASSDFHAFCFDCGRTSPCSVY
jgi:hypothetical protein